MTGLSILLKVFFFFEIPTLKKKLGDFMIAKFGKSDLLLIGKLT